MERFSITMSESERLREQLYQSLRSPGLNPQNIFMLLVALLKREFPQQEGEDLEAKGAVFRKLIETPYPDGLGMKDGELPKVLEFKHPHEIGNHKQQSVVDEMTWMRGRVARLLPGRAGDLGTNQHSRAVDNIKSKSGTDPAYIMRRLNRDRPDLAERVASGELSANAAAIEAGFRKKPVKRLTHCPHCGGEL